MAKTKMANSGADQGGGKFRLKAGQFIQADPDADEPKTNPVTGEPIGKKKSKTHNAGEVVESDIDLVARHGSEKFDRLTYGGSASRSAAVADNAPLMNQTSAPNGQVGSGYQGSHGPVSDELAAEIAADSRAKNAKDLEGADPQQRDKTVAGPKPRQADREPVEDHDDDVDDNFDAMTVSQLRQHADNKEIDLTGANSKADIVKKIRAAK